MKYIIINKDTLNSIQIKGLIKQSDIYYDYLPIHILKRNPTNIFKKKLTEKEILEEKKYFLFEKEEALNILKKYKRYYKRIQKKRHPNYYKDNKIKYPNLIIMKETKLLNYFKKYKKKGY